MLRQVWYVMTHFAIQEEDEEGDAVDMTQREAEEDDGGKVHEIKFDEYGIMDDGVDESTEEQLAKLKSAGGKCAKRSSNGMRVGTKTSFTSTFISVYFTVISICIYPGSSSTSDATAMINGVASSSTVVDGATAETGPIDEDLFDDEDLDELEEDLENLDV